MYNQGSEGIRKSIRNSTTLILIASTCLRQLYLIDFLLFILASINKRGIFSTLPQMKQV